MTETHTFRETVIEYQVEDLANWVGGEKARWLSGAVPPDIFNQKNYHFGEFFVLQHYRKKGWQGHRFYALGKWEPDNLKYVEGRKAIADRFATAALDLFRDRYLFPSGKGEPDLFLHRNELNRFLEVKKQSDHVSESQLHCLAAIRAVLKAEVGVVYLAKAGRAYKPKTYELDLVGLSGRVLSD